MLNSHPDIFLPAETLFFTSVTKRVKNRHVDTKAKLSLIFENWWIQDFGISPSEVLQQLNGRDSSMENLFLALLSVAAQKSGTKPMLIGEKTPSHVNHAEHFLKHYQHCKIIQIIRDPRAVFTSYKSVPVGTSQVAGVTQEWSKALKIHFSLQQHDRYLSIIYEDLALNPEETMRTVCAFLKTPYEPEMMNFYKRTRSGFSIEQNHHQNTLSPVFTENVDSWKSKLTKAQVALIEYKLGELMLKAGYTLEGYTVLCPRIRFQFSRLMDILSMLVVRKPRQIMKRYRALKRIKGHLL